MLISLLALATVLLTAAFLLGGLRMVAHDTVAAVSQAASRARAHGQLLPRIALILLWLMIFCLSYL